MKNRKSNRLENYNWQAYESKYGPMKGTDDLSDFFEFDSDSSDNSNNSFSYSKGLRKNITFSEGKK